LGSLSEIVYKYSGKQVGRSHFLKMKELDSTRQCMLIGLNHGCTSG